jgi:hypothetical protein
MRITRRKLYMRIKKILIVTLLFRLNELFTEKEPILYVSPFELESGSSHIYNETRSKTI